LSTVWDDVTVGEQVLFQTIRELRNLFSGLDVIKTHPRKGYAWVINVEKEALNDTNEAASQQVKNSEITTNVFSKKTKTFPWQQLVIFI
ncbi:hypothetical protein A9Q97_00715, partial [Rhodospirillales bacterium 47_12_T64]